MTRDTFDEFCGASFDFLSNTRVPYLVVGGLAVAALGEPRFTADVDVVAFTTMEDAERLIDAAAAAGFGAADDEPDRLRQTGTLRFHRGRFQLDIIVASLPFEARAHHRAIRHRLFDRELLMPTPEDMLIFKIVSGREKDVLDAVGIARRHADTLDWRYVGSGIDEICDVAEHTGPREILDAVRTKAGDLRRRMLAYYDERAPEYEEVYTLGTGSASIPDPELFKRENHELAALVARVVSGRVLDLACGTAYWLPFYARGAAHVTLVDQSANMLAESRVKAHRLGIADRCTFLQADVLDHDLAEGAFDTVLVGFFLSHLTVSEERRVFGTLPKLLAPGGRLLILDSAWTPERAKYNVKEGRQARQLNDGTPFEIYKRYLDCDDVRRWAMEYGVALRVEYLGAAFLAAVGSAPAV